MYLAHPFPPTEGSLEYRQARQALYATFWQLLCSCLPLLSTVSSFYLFMCVLPSTLLTTWSFFVSCLLLFPSNQPRPRPRPTPKPTQRWRRSRHPPIPKKHPQPWRKGDRPVLGRLPRWCRAVALPWNRSLLSRPHGPTSRAPSRKVEILPKSSPGLLPCRSRLGPSWASSWTSSRRWKPTWRRKSHPARWVLERFICPLFIFLCGVVTYRIFDREEPYPTEGRGIHSTERRISPSLFDCSVGHLDLSSGNKEQAIEIQRRASRTHRWKVYFNDYEY